MKQKQEKAGEENTDLSEEEVQLRKCVWHLTRTGELGSLTAYEAAKQALPGRKHFHTLRNLVRSSPPLCTAFVCRMLSDPLQAGDSQVRLAALRLLDLFFRKLHAVRIEVVSQLQAVFLCCLETDPLRHPLPKPPTFARQLKKESLLILRHWWTTYADAYPKLKVAEAYISSERRLELDALEGRSAAQRAHDEQMALQRLHLVTNICDRLNKTLTEISVPIESSILEIQNGLELLCPKVGVSSGEDGGVENEGEKSALNSVSSASAGRLTINLDTTPSALSKQFSTEQAPLVQAVRDAGRLLSVRLAPQLRSIISRAHKVGDCEPGRRLLQKLIKTKERVEAELSRVRELGIEVNATAPEEASTSKAEQSTNSDSDDDDDMLEVFEKLDAYNSSLLLNEDEPCSSQAAEQQQAVAVAPTEHEAVECQPSTSKQPPPPEKKYTPKLLESEDEPKSAGQQVDSPPKNAVSATTSQPAVPVVPYGLDLKYWGAPEDQLRAPEVVRNNADCHRFWRPNESDTLPSSSQPSLTERVTTFAGEFEPVQRQCRAPVADGKVCARHDRYKCPFHGVIVDRNEDGAPAAGSASTSSPAKQLPWLDATAMAEIEAQTGQRLNFGIGDRRRGRRNRRPPPLVSHRLPPEHRATRNRLKQKVLNRRSVKKVTEARTRAQHKANETKYKDNFAYSM